MTTSPAASVTIMCMTQSCFVNGNVYDTWGGGAVNTAALSSGRGWVSMAGSPGEADDRFGPDTQGQFGLLRYRLDRTQKDSGVPLGLRGLSGQLSYQNLDPSEQFYLGGPAGVRAYPVSSNGGSTGQLLTTELRWAGVAVTPLHLRAQAPLRPRSYSPECQRRFPLAPQPNSYFLQGVGLGAFGTGPDKVSFALTVVRKVGGNASAEIPTAG